MFIRFILAINIVAFVVIMIGRIIIVWIEMMNSINTIIPCIYVYDTKIKRNIWFIYSDKRHGFTAVKKIQCCLTRM